MSALAHRFGPTGRKAAALGLLACLLWALTDAVLLPLHAGYSEMGTEIDAARTQLGRVKGILRAPAPEAVDEAALGTQTWEAQSASIVAARVQEFLQTRARETGVIVISLSPLQNRPFEKFPTIGLRVECEGEIDAIRNLAAAIENAEPFLFVDGVEIRRQPIFGERQPGQFLPLSVRLDIHAPIAIRAAEG